MFSVKDIITFIRQPKGGNLSPDLFQTIKLPLTENIHVDSLDSQLTGIAVDYLVRFVEGDSALKAFDISLKGARNVGEEPQARNMVLSLNRQLDDDTISTAYRLCGYDVAYRRAPIYYRPVQNIVVSKQVIVNIRSLAKRTVSFLDEHGGITESEVTFEGAYNEILSSGDCDFLTKHALWDLKVSKRWHLNSHYTLQLLLYYILGTQSIHKERFKSIKYLGIINPLAGVAYQLNIDSVADFKDIVDTVCHEVIGYNGSDGKYSGTNEEIKIRAQKALARHNPPFNLTSFNPNTYRDGIYDISIDDYCTFFLRNYEKMHNQPAAAWKKPQFKFTKSIKFLKHDGYLMFISVSPKGQLSVLRGGHRLNLSQDVQYYYGNLPAYANQVLNLFSGYWDALSHLSSQLKQIPVDKRRIRRQYKMDSEMRQVMGEQQLTKDEFINEEIRSSLGYFHGLIMDIDYFNHLYINPQDGKVTAYNADNIMARDTYPNVGALLKDQVPALYNGYKKMLQKRTNSFT